MYYDLASDCDGDDDDDGGGDGAAGPAAGADGVDGDAVSRRQRALQLDGPGGCGCDPGRDGGHAQRHTARRSRSRLLHSDHHRCQLR